MKKKLLFGLCLMLCGINFTLQAQFVNNPSPLTSLENVESGEIVYFRMKSYNEAFLGAKPAADGHLATLRAHEDYSRFKIYKNENGTVQLLLANTSQLDDAQKRYLMASGSTISVTTLETDQTPTNWELTFSSTNVTIKAVGETTYVGGVSSGLIFNSTVSGFDGNTRDRNLWQMIREKDEFNLSLATKDNPVDVSSLIFCRNFETSGDRSPYDKKWVKNTTGGTQQRGNSKSTNPVRNMEGSYYWQIWGGPFSGEQYLEITGLENGVYSLKALAFVDTGTGTLFANEKTTNVAVASGGSQYEIPNIVISDGYLKIGLQSTDVSTSGLDDFKLYYYGPVDLSYLENQLQGLITIANEITANMNTEVASALSTAISTAETLLQDENRTEDDLNDTIDVLTTAIANANANINALDELNTALTGADNLLSENMYSGVLSALQTQINTADGLTDPIGTTAELTSALSSLQTAVNAANSSIANYNYLSTLIATAENKPAKADEGKTELDVIAAPVKTALEAKTLDDAAMTSAELKALIEAVNTYLFAGTTNQTSKITNPSFEAGTSHPATGWTFNAVTSGYADFKINASASHAGNNHYNIWAANVTSINVSQNLELPAGTYALSAAFRVGAVSNQHIYATIGENTVNSLPINKIYGDSEWQTVSLNFTLPEAATVTIGAASTGSGSGTAGWMRLDDFQLASLVLDDYTLSDLKVAGTTIAGFSATTYNYTYYVAPGTTIVPEVSGTATSGTISSLTQAAAIPGTATITVTAESGTTKDYTVDFVVDYMAGWDYNLNAGTPADAGWTTSDDAVVLGTGTEIYRDNMYGYARVLQQYKPEVTFYYPVQLEEGKIYKLTASWCWVWEGSSPTSTFGMYDDEKSLLKSIESTSTANSGNDRKTVELSFVASSTGTYYFGWTSNTGRNIIWGLSLIETGDAIEIAFDARNEGEGVAIEPQYLMDGDKIVMPAIPTYNGWVFEGWYTDNGTFQNAWDFENATVDQSITLYAKWSNDISVGLEDNNVEKMNIVSLQGGIKIQSNTVQNINIYALTGQLVKQAIVQEGTTFVELPIGMYIVNNKKVVVR